MKIALTGATGFIGQTICSIASPHQIIGFSRNPSLPLGKVSEWRNSQDLDFSGCDAVIHLAGESIMGWWNSAKKQKILQSRVEMTRRVVDALAKEKKVKCLIAASAIGYYGNAGEEVCDESSPPGSGFLAEVACAWEAESLRAEKLGVRTVRLRNGFVLGRSGGALPLIKSIFRTGLGGQLGDGSQWMSCIHVKDVAKLAIFCIEHPEITGAMNAVMPKPIRNRDFTKEIGQALHRYTFLSAPAFILRWSLGGLSHLLLDSQYVVPSRAQQAGYSYIYSTVHDAVREAVS